MIDRAPRVIVYIAASLDGFIADRDGGVGWLNNIEPSSSDGDFGYAEFFDSIGSLVMGRATYDHVLTFGEWPYPANPTYVVASNSPDGDHQNVEFVSGDLKTFVDGLKARSDQDIWHVGGGKLIASFREHGLIDEYIVTVLPDMLGGSVQRFPDEQPAESLRLADLSEFENGLVQLEYSCS